MRTRGTLLDENQGLGGLEDDRLVEMARAGSMAAFDELYRRHVGAARATARYLLARRQETDDVVSEAFAGVLSALRSGRGPRDNFRWYLMACVRNGCASRGRTARCQPVDPTEVADRSPAVEDPERYVEADLVASAFATLSPRWQRVLWLTEVEDRPLVEVADDLQLPLGAASAVSHRARQAFAEAYLGQYVARQPGELCAKLSPKYAHFVRGRTSDVVGRRIDDHLLDCPSCASAVEDLRDVNQCLRSLQGPGTAIGVGAVASGAALTGASGALGTASVWGSMWGSLWGTLSASIWGAVAGAGILAPVVASLVTGAPVGAMDDDELRRLAPGRATAVQLDDGPTGPGATGAGGATDDTDVDVPAGSGGASDATGPSATVATGTAVLPGPTAAGDDDGSDDPTAGGPGGAPASPSSGPTTSAPAGPVAGPGGAVPAVGVGATVRVDDGHGLDASAGVAVTLDVDDGGASTSITTGVGVPGASVGVGASASVSPTGVSTGASVDGVVLGVDAGAELDVGVEAEGVGASAGVVVGGTGTGLDAAVTTGGVVVEVDPVQVGDVTLVTVPPVTVTVPPAVEPLVGPVVGPVLTGIFGGLFGK